MPRQHKGPRLYLRKGRTVKGKTLPDRYFIRDGSVEIGTGCGPERVDEAEKQLAAYISEKWTRPAGESDPARVLVADVLALYSREKADALGTDSASMKGFVRNLLTWWGDKALSDVKRTSCRAYVAWRVQQPRHGFKDQESAPRVSNQTARRELEVLSAAIGYWDQEHHLTRRPMVVLPEKAESSRDALTRAQAAAILYASLGHRREGKRWTALDSSSGKANRAHLRRFLLIGIYTGTRAGAIKRLRWTESLHDPWVDLDAGIIYRRGRQERESATKKRPLVKVPRRLIAHMRRWKEADELAERNTVLHHGGREVGSIRRAFAACAKDAGVTATPHWLRHTAATWLMEAGVDLWEAAGYLGMTSATLEKHYGHHRPDHQLAARSALG